MMKVCFIMAYPEGREKREIMYHKKGKKVGRN
jgi:hypothetical protein